MTSGLDEQVLHLIDEFGHAARMYGGESFTEAMEDYYSAKDALITYLAERMSDVNSKD
jgi:hypothetical protein